MALDTNGFPLSGQPILKTVSDRMSITGGNPVVSDWEFLKPMTTDGFRGTAVGTNQTYNIKFGVVRASSQDYAGVWMSQALPSVSNYSFLYANGSIFNTPSGTTMSFRVANSTYLSLSASQFTINVNTFTSNSITAQSFYSGGGGLVVSNAFDYINTTIYAEPYSYGGGMYGDGHLFLKTNPTSSGYYADIQIVAGVTSSGSGNGGNVYIKSGDEYDNTYQTNSYYSGNIDIKVGDASYGNAGSLNITGGIAYDYSGYSTYGGNVVIKGGDYSGSSGGYAGHLYLTGGTATSVGYGGNVYINGGYDTVNGMYSTVSINSYGGSLTLGAGTGQFYAQYTGYTFTESSGGTIYFQGQLIDIQYANVQCNGDANFATYTVNGTAGYTGDLNDSTSTKIADVVSGLITAVYY